MFLVGLSLSQPSEVNLAEQHRTSPNPLLVTTKTAADRHVSSVFP
jgi:hypothetical protein